MSFRTRSWKIAKRVFIAIGALALVVVLLVSLTLGTRVGRNLLLVQALAFVNDAIPGRVQVLDFNELSFSSLELRGIAIFDPAGTQVVSLGLVRFEADLLALRPDDLRVARVRLHDGFVDVSNIEQKRRGLLAAFVDPDAPPSPPSTTPPPYVRVLAIELDALSVTLPRPAAAAPDKVERLSVRGNFELDTTPRARIESLSFDVKRDAERIVRVTELKALLGRGEEASSLTLVADLSGARLAVSAKGVAPPGKSWRTAPLNLDLKLTGVTAERVSVLAGDDSLGALFLGPVALDVGVSGSVHALKVALNLGTAGGKLELTALLDDLRRLGFELRVPGLTPSRVQSQAPPHAVVATLKGRADLSQAPESFRVQWLELSDASFAGEPLPRLEASALVSQRDLRQLKLEVADAASSVHIDGEAGFDGSAKLAVVARIEAATLRRLAALVGETRRIDGSLSADLKLQRVATGRVEVKGQLKGKNLAFDKTSLRALGVSVDLKGEPPALAGAIDVRLERLQAGEALVRTAALQVRGGPERYRVVLSARSNQGDVDLTSKLTLEKSGGLLVEAKATGQRDGHPVALEVASTRISPAGGVATDGVRLRLAEQVLEVRGSASATDAVLEIEAEKFDLAVLNKLLALKEKLGGTVSLRADVRGGWQRPVLVLELKGRGIAFGERPELDLALSGQLNAPEGVAELKLDVSDVKEAPRKEHRLHALVNAETRFSPRVPLAEAFEGAEYRARLELKQLDLEFVEANLPEVTLPVTGEVKAALELSGRAAAPALALHVDADLSPAWSKRRLSVSHDLVIDNERLAADLQVSDPDGVWIDLNLTASLPPFDQLSERAAQIAHRERWRVKLALAERELSQLPIPPEQRASIPELSVGGALDAAHEPEQEPEVDLQLVLRQKSAAASAAMGCTTKEMRVDTDLTLSHGQVQLRLLGREAQRELVKLEAKAEVLLASALGGGKPELGRISAHLKSSELELASLPFVCQRFGGRVNLTANVDDALGERPNAELALRISNLTAGSRTSVDTSLDAFIKPDQAGFDAKVRHGVNTSTAKLRLPVKLGNGRFTVEGKAPLQGELVLRHLPIEPFLDPAGAISYATGTLSGQAKLSGTLKQPRASGTIELEQLGFTATDMAQPLRNVEGQVRFTERRVQLKGFQAHDKEGVLKLDGSVDFGNLARVVGDFHVRAKKFPLRQQGQVVATTDLDTKIRTTLTPQKSRVKITLIHVDTWLESASVRQGIALAGHHDLVVDGSPAVKGKPDEATSEQGASDKKAGEKPRPVAKAVKPKPPGTKPKKSAKVTEIVLDARDKFWVKRDDFAVKLAALVTARIEGEEVRVEGTVEIDRGYLQLFGKGFEIQRGSELEFIGSPQPNPVLNITAVHENRRSGESVTVQITGRGSAPELTFLVDGVVVTAGDAFVALFGTQRSSEDPEAAGDQAKNFVGGLTAGLLATAARRELGAAAPILMVEPGGETDETRIRAGFELDSVVPEFLKPIVMGMYFEGIVANDQNANAQDANVNGGALLEIYFPRDFFTTGQYGPGTTWSVDVGWQL